MKSSREAEQIPFSALSFDNNNQSDPRESPPYDPNYAERLDDKELSYEVDVKYRASEDIASIAIQKKNALYINTVFKPFALSELNWAQLCQLERSRNHG